MNLDKLSVRAAIALMLREDEKIPSAILSERKKIEQAVTMIVRSFKRGGRLFYAGAGTFTTCMLPRTHDYVPSPSSISRSE